MERNQHQVYTEYLILNALDGDSQSFGRLVNLWQPRLRRFALRMTSAPDAVHDILQDVWVAVSKRLDRLDDPACFKRWLYRITSNKCVDWIRKQERMRRLKKQYAAELEVEKSPEENLPRTTQIVRDAIQVLPYEQRLLIALYYEESFRVSEISFLLSVPKGTVKSRLFKIRSDLKKLIEKEL